MARFDAYHRQSRLRQAGIQPPAERAGLDPDLPVGQIATAQKRRDGFRLALHLALAHDLTGCAQDADARATRQNIRSDEMVHHLSP